MRQIRYSLTFEGRAAPEDEMGVQMRIEGEAMLGPWLDPLFTDSSPTARFDSVVENEEEGVFSESGTISFGRGSLSFSTYGSGSLEPSEDPTLQHGVVIWQIDGGTGVFEGASGYITSNFTVSENADVVDTQAGVIFLPD